MVGQKSRFMYRSDKCLVLCIGRTYVVVGQMSGWTNVGTEKCWVGKMLVGHLRSDKSRITFKHVHSINLKLSI